jgi:Fungal cellulose binding domain
LANPAVHFLSLRTSKSWAPLRRFAGLIVHNLVNGISGLEVNGVPAAINGDTGQLWILPESSLMHTGDSAPVQVVTVTMEDVEGVSTGPFYVELDPTAVAARCGLSGDARVHATPAAQLLDLPDAPLGTLEAPELVPLATVPSIAAAAAAPGSADTATANTQGCSEGYLQCGGIDWDGPTCCVAGYACEAQNVWFSQCLPGCGCDVTRLENVLCMCTSCGGRPHKRS